MEQEDKLVRDAKSAFATYYKKERDRSETTLGIVLNICCDDQISPVEQVQTILQCLESHWLRVTSD